jgi:Tol biopolymer transport system component
MNDARIPGLERPGGSRASHLPVVLCELLALLLVLSPSPTARASTDGITTPLPSASRRPPTTFSFRPWMSADGRFVAFDSDAGSLVPADTNGVRDVFLYDRATATTTRVSVGVHGAQSNGQSQRPTLSANGRYVAFWSAASNLVEGDTNGVTDAFVYDRDAAVTIRVSVGPSGLQADGASARPVISADGAVVAFESAATNLGPPGLLNRPSDTNAVRDVFVYDVPSATTTRVSVTSDGKQGTGESVRPTISGDGRYVAFQSDAVLEPGDTNAARDVYVYDRTTNATTRVSAAPGGNEGPGGSFSPSLSSDGRYVAFWSNSANLVDGDTNGAPDVFVGDREGGAIERVSVASDSTESDAPSSDPSISPDGRWVAFWSAATTLVPNDTNDLRDVFLHDRDTHSTALVSVASDGSQSDADSYSPNVAAGNGVVAFDSGATNLVRGDTNRGSDIFVHTESPPAPPPSEPPPPAPSG